MDRSRLIVLDIETYHTRSEAALERIRRTAIDKRPPGNAKKEDKMAWDTVAARKERAQAAVDKTAVDVLLAEPLCVCWGVYGHDSQLAELQSIDFMRCPEKSCLKIIADAWEQQAGPETIWIGHNIEKFDLPILLNRWRRHGIVPPEHFPVYNAGRWRGRVWDTMLRTPVNSGVNMVSLTAVCEAYDLSSAKASTPWLREPMDGSRVAAAYETGEYDLILEYCAEDINIQAELYMAQTANDTWGTFPKHEDLTEGINDILESDLTQQQKAMALTALKGDARS